MCLMSIMLSEYLDKFVLIFIDNIIVYSNTKEENENHFMVVLQVLRECQLYAN